MLQHAETYDEPGTLEDGTPVVWIKFTGRWVDDPCYLCGEESHRQVCPGDGRYHHHGMVHTKPGGLEAVCNTCIRTVEDEWGEAHRLYLDSR